ncbi:hypothetical protein PHYBOEH_006322 [Phytophthora boehmeriae]|uniref:HECT-type E3 ubiquitin transferase n=1 Tax=Phytophthora boehmeriae TaxID=109152 RepID=A0A8T1WEK7_9STRA|nr:hypothetical protein PHYBOEH_006322 [Phytophthora boehmeriae]
MSAGVIVVVVLSVLLFVGAIILLLFFCRRIQVQRERESLVFIQEPADVYREELNDSFMEQALWRCGVCKFLNHPERKLCDLCQTLRGAERDVASGNKKQHSRHSYSQSHSRGSFSNQRMGRIGETEAFSSSHADDAIGGSFGRPSFEFLRKVVSKPPKLSKLQLAASRRQQWKRMPTTDGLHRWDSFELVADMKPYQLRQRWRVVFEGEPALDAGGVMREWFTLLFAELFDPNFGMFVSTVGDERSYWINATSDALLGEEDHLAYFEFAGRLVGKAILEEHLMPVHLALPFLKHILGVPISFSDLQFLDDEIYNSAQMVKKIDDIEPLCLDFTATKMVDGKPEIVELVEGGANIDVTRENRTRYLDALFKYHVLGSVSDQLLAFLTALYDVVPEGLLKLFDYQELELLMCGVPSIDVEDWKKHTDFKFFTHNFPTELELNNIEWLWEVVEDMRNEDRVRLLQFATGTSRVPAQGFKGLISSDGRVRRFNVAFAGTNQSFLFPKAHTCFNRLDLPIYNSKEVLAEYIKLIVQMDITGFTIE